MTDSIVLKRIRRFGGVLLGSMPFLQAYNLIFIDSEKFRMAWSDLFQALSAILAAAFVTMAAFRLRKEKTISARAWTVISIATCMFAAGMIAFMYIEVGMGVQAYPGVPDIFFFFFYPTMIVGLSFLPREKLQGPERWDAILDLCAFGLVAAMIIWHFNLRLLVQSLAVQISSDVLVSLCYTLLDTILLFLFFSLLIRKLGSGRQFVPALLFVLGGFSLISSDLFQGYVSTYGDFVSGSPVDMGWVLSATLNGFAGLYILGDSGSERYHDVSRTVWAVIITYLWIGLACAILTWAMFHREVVHPGLIITGVFGAVTLALVRQIRSIRDKVMLYASVKEAHDRLEEKVLERTRELSQEKEKAEVLAKERGELLASLQASREEQQLVARNVNDLIWAVNPSLCFTYANPAVQRILGWTIEEFLTLSIEDIMSEESLALVMAAIEEERGAHNAPKALRNRLRGLELELLRKDGSTFPGEMSVSCQCQENGNPVQFIGITRDITERRNLEQQVIQHQKMEGIGMLAGGVAHDINNLLTPIYFSVEMATKDFGPNHPLAPRLQVIMSAAQRISDLVRQLLFFSRKQQTKQEVLELNNAVSGFMKILRRIIRESIELEMHLSDMPCFIKADRTQLEQILMNLAVNAQDAIEGVGRITVETGSVYLDREYCSNFLDVSPGKYQMLSVTDSGSGMDEKTRNNIFQPFFTTKPQGKGTGLGLSTVFGVVKQHNAHMDVISSPGEGSIFRVYFPTVGESADVVVSAEAEQLPELSFVGTLLLVEDDVMLREALCEALGAYGLRILAAGSPLEAVALFKEHRDDITLLLTDVVMPEMSGPELYHTLKGIREDLSVLYMSGYANNAERYREVIDAPELFLQKPFTIKTLILKLRSIPLRG